MNVKHLLMAFVLAVVCCFAMPAFAQEQTVNGNVTDSAGQALSGATVLVKGTNIGTQTSSSGTFTIKLPANRTTLIISSVGYAQEEVNASNSDNISITLRSLSNALADIVVVGYGTRQRRDLTGSVTAISSKDFQKGTIPSAEQLIQGKAAGLQVTTGGGAAGGGSKIRIRGGASLNANNDPLIVIDGMPVDNNGLAGSANFLNTINPNDIESISILKDASAAALYGSRASNGVLIITTKKGSQGGAVKFNFSTNNSIGIINKTTDVLSADQLRDIVNADAVQTGSNTYKNLLGTANTNWQDAIFRKAFGSDNTLSVSGGIKKLPYRLSVGYYNQNGTLKTNNFQRTSAALNLSPKFLDNHLSVNISLQGTFTKNRFANEGAIGSAIAFDPTQPVYADNKYGGYFEWLQADGTPFDLATRNPLALLELRDDRSNVARFRGNIQVDYKLHFFPDLHVQANLGYDYSRGKGHTNIDSSLATNYKTLGSFSKYYQRKITSFNNVSLFYEKNIASIKSKVDVLLLHEWQDNKTEDSSYASYGQTGILIPGSTPTFTFNAPQYRIESYLGRLNYSYAGKYLLTASIRRDASSRFSPDTRVGYFPAASAAWRLKDDFFKTTSFLNDLKLRVGWGETGQQDIGDLYGYLPRYTLSNSTAQYQLGDSFYYLYRPAGYIINKWETTQTTNVGLDFSFLNNRISGTVDYYNRKTKDLLSNVPIAPGANFVNEIIKNVGDMKSSGFEFAINTTPVRTTNFSWDFGFNFTYQKVEITKLTERNDPAFKGIDVGGISGGTGNTIQKHNIGYAPNTFFVYKQVYDNKTGKPIEGLYEDINRDGQITDDDRYYYKSAIPDFLVGFTTQVSYKQFSLSLAGHGMFGNYMYNNVNSNNGVLRAVKNPLLFIGNASTDYYNTGFDNNRYLSDYYISNASFVRLDNINLGYNIGKIWSNKASLRLLGSVQNVFVITKYNGLDPENAGIGIDNTIYPRPTVFTLGANLDF